MHIAHYQRRKETGTLTLQGVVDIFEAAPLQEEALRAVRDPKATEISVDLESVEHLDVAALQILIALQKELTSQGRAFTLCNAPQAVTKTVAELGLAETI